MGDSLHQEIFASNKLFVSPQGWQLWSWNKNEIIVAITDLQGPAVDREYLGSG